MYKVEKEKIVGIVFIAFLAIFLLINQNPFENEEEKFQKNLIRTRDLAYIKWIEDISYNIESHIKIISNSKDYNDVELHGRMLKEEMQKQIDNSQYQISPELRPLDVDFKKYLENYYNVGKFIEIGVKNNDDNSINMALNYSKDASNIMEDISKIVEDYMKKNNIKKR